MLDIVLHIFLFSFCNNETSPKLFFSKDREYLTMFFLIEIAAQMHF